MTRVCEWCGIEHNREEESVNYCSEKCFEQSHRAYEEDMLNLVKKDNITIKGKKFLRRETEDILEEVPCGFPGSEHYGGYERQQMQTLMKIFGLDEKQATSLWCYTTYRRAPWTIEGVYHD
jgi:hypothetical protein